MRNGGAAHKNQKRRGDLNLAVFSYRNLIPGYQSLATSHQSPVTSDLNATFGHRPIYIRGEAATFIPNSSFEQNLQTE